MFDKAEITKIPGMIEPVEQKLLYDIASQLTLHEDDQFVEFGTFFGRSTACLAQGLIDNKTRNVHNKLYAYDSFSCAVTGGFVEHVEKFAISGNVQKLLNYEGNKVDFLNVFQNYLAPYINSGVVHPVKAELSASNTDKIKSIGLMHIDSPKFYQEFKIILYKFFPLIRDGAVIIFQDFFYHWSATLIAAIEALRQSGCIEYRMSAASSLVVQFNGPISSELLFDIDMRMSEQNEIEKLLLSAIEQTDKFQIDRPEIFIPRLWLATFQYLWENNNHHKSTNLIIDFVQRGGQINNSVIEDFIELMQYGLTMRDKYNSDRNVF